MGVVARQGFKHSIVSFTAILFGTVNTLFIFTEIFTPQELGLYRYLAANAQLLYPFILIGFSSVAVRYHAIFKQKAATNNGFLFFLLIVTFLVFLFFSLGFYVFRAEIFYFFYKDHEDASLLWKFLSFIPLLVFGMMYISLLNNYTYNFRRIVVPEIITNLWIKIAIPIAGLGYFLDFYNYYFFIVLVVIAYWLAPIALLLPCLQE